MKEAVEKAEQLLPCRGLGSCNQINGAHAFPCPAAYRPAVAAALREVAERHDKLWEMDCKIIGDLKEERDAMEKERDGYALAIESTLQEKLYWKVQADSAYVRGLERAKEIVYQLFNVLPNGLVNAIQAEIDKAKTGK